MDKETIVLLKEAIALLTVWVKRGVPQSTLIMELSGVGLQPKQIAELLGTTPNTVRVAIHQIKNKRKK